MTIEIDLDRRKILEIIKCFEHIDYNQNLVISLKHKTNKRIDVGKYPVLCSIVNEVRSKGYKVEVHLENNDNCPQLTYASRMGFLSMLDIL